MGAISTRVGFSRARPAPTGGVFVGAAHGRDFHTGWVLSRARPAPTDVWSCVCRSGPCPRSLNLLQYPHTHALLQNIQWQCARSQHRIVERPNIKFGAELFFRALAQR